MAAQVMKLESGPHQVRIGPLVYSILLADRITDPEGRRACGEYQYTPAIIRLERGMNAQVERLTLWHEIIHCILNHAGYSVEETVIETLCSGVYQALQDNPWLGQEAK